MATPNPLSLQRLSKPSDFESRSFWRERGALTLFKSPCDKLWPTPRKKLWVGWEIVWRGGLVVGGCLMFCMIRLNNVCARYNLIIAIFCPYYSFVSRQMQTCRHTHTSKPKVSASCHCFHLTKWHWMLEEVQINLLSHQLLFHWWSGSHFTAKQLREAALKYFGIWVKTQTVFLESSSSRRTFSTHGRGLMRQNVWLFACVIHVCPWELILCLSRMRAHIKVGSQSSPSKIASLALSPLRYPASGFPAIKHFQNWRKCSIKIISRCQFYFSGLG